MRTMPHSTDPPANPGRRGFQDLLLRGGLLTLIAGVVYPLVRFIIPPRQAEAIVSSVVAAKVGAMKPNSGKVFPMGKEPAILIDAPGGELRAFSAIRTHLSCTVQYRPDLQHIWCACHNGHYDLHGKNISGPPPRPPTPYKVAIHGNEVIVSKG